MFTNISSQVLKKVIACVSTYDHLLLTSIKKYFQKGLEVVLHKI